MDVLTKKVKVTKSGGNGNTKKVTIPSEMASALQIQLGDKITWIYCIDEESGEKYLKLIPE